MAETTTAFTGRTFMVCGCCTDHDDRPLTDRIVTCSTCGQPCSCEGCVAESVNESERSTDG